MSTPMVDIPIDSVCIEFQNSVSSRVKKFYDGYAAFLKISQRPRQSFYWYYPLLFSGAFPRVTQEELFILAVAGIHYADHIGQLDSFVDDPDVKNADRIILSVLLNTESLNHLHSLFPHDSSFWTYLAGYQRDFFQAVLSEKQTHFGRVKPLTEGQFFDLAKNKAGLSKLVTTGLAIMDGLPGPVETLSRSQDQFNAACQMYDDIVDLRDDLAGRQYTYLLSAGITGAGLPESDLLSFNPHAVDELFRYIYYSGLIEDSLKMASGWCTDALETVRELPVLRWNSVVSALRTRLENLASDLGSIRETMIRRSEAAAVLVASKVP